MNSTLTDNPKSHVDLSLVVPCYNEERNVAAFFDVATKVFDATDYSYEIVFINDGSADGTMAALKQLVEENASGHRVSAIGFSRNFGKESAIYAGMKAARGDAVCLIDADLQQRPEIALQMYEHLVSHEECDVVAAYQSQRHEGAIKGFVKRRFYKVFNRATDDIELPENMSDFRVFCRSVAEALLSMPEYHRFSKGLFSWVGFHTHAVPYEADERNAGESAWSTWKLIKYAATGIESFSTWPLKAVKYIGLISFVAALLYLLYTIIVDYLILGTAVAGYPTIVCLILVFGGLQLFVLGIMAEYQARSFIEQKHRPLYVIREKYETEEGAE